MFRIRLPQDAAALLQALQGAGYTAYIVGGCVRDALLGRVPGDWDICTSAKPEEIKALFADEKLLLTGEKHGTVAVLRHGCSYEITTYRLDGDYADHRHPDRVRFVSDLAADLARRDFTVNAMAYAPGTGLVDLYGGRRDLASQTIRCVGDPNARFGEDALRILRALRFAAQLDFTLDEATAAAAAEQAATLADIAPERIYAELDRLLQGHASARVLGEHGAVLAGAVPEIAPCIGCTQPGRWHCYDVWQHTAVTVGAVDASGQDARGMRVLYWSAFLHDLAKPGCRSVGPDGAAHFRGHNQRGALLARLILRRLHAPSYLCEGAAALIAIHDSPFPRERGGTLRWLGRHGTVFMHRLCALKYADLAAHAQTSDVAARRAEVADFEARATALAKTECYTIRQLAVTGADIMAQGIPAGPLVGQILDRLLNDVMDGVLPNEGAALLQAVTRYRKETETIG